MARRKRKSSPASSDGWLVTFSDLMTLLLTFFVLLLSMSSMDTVIISRISAHFANPTVDDAEAAGRIPARVMEVLELLRDPENVLLQQDRIKDLLFPYDVLPPEVTTGDIAENLRILQHPEGVVIVLTEGLLFPEGAAELTPVGKKLLEALSPVILAVETDVNISGHTDNKEAVGQNPYELSGFRAIAVLEQFLLYQIKPDRFSVSGYGPDKPMESNSTAAGRAKNRRVEILLKVNKWVGSYS